MTLEAFLLPGEWMKFHRYSGISGGEPASDEELLLQDKKGDRRGGEESGDVWNWQ